MRIINLFLFLLLIGSLNLFAQEKVKEIPLTNIKGTAIGNNNESISQIMNRAINNAKIEALKKVGVEENILSYTDYFKFENNDSYDELFISDILSDIRGAVKNVEVIDTIKEFNDYGHISVQIKINCVVVKYLSKKDLSFGVWIDGVRAFYTNEAQLNFKLKTTKNAYVNIFVFNEDEAYLLFPSEYEKSFLLQSNIEYSFPTHAAEYILFTKKKSEVHRMIMVFTKEEISYTGEISYKEIIDWIFSIPPDIRMIKSFGFTVVQEDKL